MAYLRANGRNIYVTDQEVDAYNDFGVSWQSFVNMMADS